MKVLLPVAGRNARRGEKTTENFSRLQPSYATRRFFEFEIYSRRGNIFLSSLTIRLVVPRIAKIDELASPRFTKDLREKEQEEEEEEEEEEEGKYGGPYAISRAINFSSILSFSLPFSLFFFFFISSSSSRYLYRGLPTPRHKSPRLFFIDIPDIAGHVPLNRNQIAIAARTLFLPQDNASRTAYVRTVRRIHESRTFVSRARMYVKRKRAHACTLCRRAGRISLT